jgi:hypothetical protein
MLCLETEADYAILVSMLSVSISTVKGLTRLPVNTSDHDTDAAGEANIALTSEEQAAINRKDQMTVCDAFSNSSAHFHKYSA